MQRITGKYPGTLGIKELEDLANRLKVSNIALIGAGIGTVGASVAALYFLPSAALYLGLAGVYSLEYIRCRSYGDLECMVKGLKIGGIFAIKGLVSAGSAMGFGLYGAHLYAKKENHKPVDAVFIEKLKELQELEKQSEQR